MKSMVTMFCAAVALTSSLSFAAPKINIAGSNSFQVSLTGLSNADRILLGAIARNFDERIAKKRDIDPAKALEFLTAASSFGKRSKKPLLGKYSNECVKNVAPKALNSLMEFGILAKGSTSDEEALQFMARKFVDASYQSNEIVILETDAAVAEEKGKDKVCALVGASCQLFGTGITETCKKREAERLRAKIHEDLHKHEGLHEADGYTLNPNPQPKLKPKGPNVGNFGIRPVF